MKKILIITHAFPPGAGSGVIRTLKFAKYLPENGWQPILLTVDDRYNEKKDSSMVAEIPAGTVIRRTSMIDPFVFYREVKNTAIKRAASPTSTCQVERGGGQNLLQRMRAGIRVFLTTPDRFVGWVIPGTRAGLRLIREQKPDAIYSTSPVETPHIIGLLLKKWTRLPWIIDLRDPWMLRYETQRRNRILMAVEGWLERTVMKHADAVIANNDFLKLRYLTKYGSLIEHKLHVVVNGYDAEDFNGMDKAGEDNGFVVSHVGEFYHRMRTPDAFLRAFAELLHEETIPKQDAHINFVGAGDYVETPHFVSLVKQLGIGDTIQLVAHQQHKESIRRMFASDVLLLLQPDPMNKAQIPAKAFEYLRTGKPILAITQRDGATGMLLSGFKQATVVEPDDHEGIKRHIARLYRERGIQAACDHEKISAYDRRGLTGKLARIADSVCGTNRNIRILHLLPSLETGGMENGVVNLVNGLDDSRFSSIICCLERGGELQKRLKPGVTVIELSQKQGIRFGLVFLLKKLFREQKIDLVHTHNFYALVYGALAAGLAGIPVVHGEHGRPQNWPRRRRYITLFLSKRVKTILTVSHSLKEILLREGIAAHRIKVIPNGIDAARYISQAPSAEEKASLGISDGDIVIGSVGRLVPVKDYKTLIQAFSLMRGTNGRVRLLLVGDGVELDALRAYAAQNSCADRVIFLGQRTDVTSLYRFMHIFALSSLSEGMSNVILEAMAAGLPVVATRVGDNGLLVENNVSGMLVEPGDARALADALTRLVSDLNTAAAMGERGRSRAVELYGIERMVNDYKEIYTNAS